MSRHNCIRTLLIVLALCVPLWTEAKLVLYSFEEKVLSSSSIIIGEVQSISGGFIKKPCAKVEVVRLIRGTMPESPLVVRYGEPVLTMHVHEDTTKVNEGRQYVMFLTREKHEYRLVGADDGIYEIDAKGQVWDGNAKVPVETFIAKVLAVPPTAATSK